MLLAFVLLLIGFVLLVKGADVFVDGSSSIAKFLKIPSIVIGLTIVAFGTSAPEAAVSIIAGIDGSNDIAVGNVIGSNMFNLLVVMGLSAAIKPINIQKQIVRSDYPFMLLATLALAAMSFDVFFGNGSANTIARNDAVILLMFMAIFLFYVISSALSTRKAKLDSGIAEEEEKPKYGIGLSILCTIGGLAGIVIGGQLVVDSAKKIALGFGMSETLVGLTIVAVGTSLPELVTSIMAARKGESDIAVGNVVGSNIFNILFVLPASAVITPIIDIDPKALVDMIILIAVSILAYIFCTTKKNVNRAEGIILFLLYVGYMVFAIAREY